MIPLDLFQPRNHPPKEIVLPLVTGRKKPCESPTYTPYGRDLRILVESPELRLPSDEQGQRLLEVLAARATKATVQRLVWDCVPVQQPADPDPVLRPGWFERLLRRLRRG